jgi:hypothetical protein
MPYFIQRPVTAEAHQLTHQPDTAKQILAWLDHPHARAWSTLGHRSVIDHLEILGDRDTALARPGDWIVRDRFGRVTVCDDAAFGLLYQEIE